MRREIEALAAGDDRVGQLVSLGRGEEELHVRGRLLEGLQEVLNASRVSMWASSMM